MAFKSPYRGMLVYQRKSWGSDAGMVDESCLYRVGKIGPKMATLYRVNKETLQQDHYRGHTTYLHSKEEAEAQNARNDRGGYRSMYYWDWSQVFVPQGEAGWDPSENF